MALCDPVDAALHGTTTATQSCTMDGSFGIQHAWYGAWLEKDGKILQAANARANFGKVALSLGFCQ